MSAKAFIDTNIFIYIQRTDEPGKKQIAESAISCFDCVASTQVLNEVCNILTKKYPSPHKEIVMLLNSIHETCDVVPIGDDIINHALSLHFRFSLSYFDALMAAAALKAGCKYLISEDMQDGLIIEDRLTIINIFAHTDLLA